MNPLDLLALSDPCCDFHPNQMLWINAAGGADDEDVERADEAGQCRDLGDDQYNPNTGELL